MNFLRGYLRFARFLTLMTAKAINGHEFSVNPSTSTPRELVQLIKTRGMVIISRCSKLLYTVSRCYFHIESTFSDASVSFLLGHIGRFLPIVPPVVRDMNHRRRNQLPSENVLSMSNPFRTPPRSIYSAGSTTALHSMNCLVVSPL